VKKNALFMTVILSIIVISSILASLSIHTAKANGMFQRRFDASPIITVQKPQNNKTCAPENVTLFFNLIKPTADLDSYPYRNNWYDPIVGSNDGPDFGNKVVNATCYIDGQPTNISIEVNSHLQEPFNYSLPIEGLAEGNHTLQIQLFCNGLDGFVWMAGGSLSYIDYTVYSETVNFTVGSPDAAIITSDTLSGLAIEIIAVTVVIVCLGAALLLFSFNQKRQKNIEVSSQSI
jgi:hypothetical protein